MAMGCLDEDIHNQYYGAKGQGAVWQGLASPGIFAGQEQKRSRKVLKAKGTGGSGTITTSYPVSDYATNFLAGASTGSTYTAGGGISVTTTGNSLSNCYTLTDAVNMK